MVRFLGPVHVLPYHIRSCENCRGHWDVMVGQQGFLVGHETGAFRSIAACFIRDLGVLPYCTGLMYQDVLETVFIYAATLDAVGCWRFSDQHGAQRQKVLMSSSEIEQKA